MNVEKTLCQEALRVAARSFRLGMEGQASNDLVAFVDNFMPLLKSFGELDVGRVTSLLGELLSAQSRKDYLYVADLLEYEIAHLLQE